MSDLSDFTEAELLEGVAATSKDELARMGEMMVVNTQAQILAENPGIPLAVIKAMLRQQFTAALAVLNAGEREAS